MPIRLIVTRTFVLIALAGALAVPLGCRSSTEPGERVLTLDVAPARVACAGLVPYQCLQVRVQKDEPYTPFYDTIVGFTYEPGYRYLLWVGERAVSNPLADGSDREYRLIAVLAKTAAATDSARVP